MKTKRTVRNCPRPFRFRCSKLWDDLAETGRPGVRRCGDCESDVYFCSTDEETVGHAKAGHCIAREVPDQSELPVIAIGVWAVPPMVDPTPSQKEALTWNAREEGIADSLMNATRSTRSCSRCTYPAPDWRKMCRVCGFEMGRASAEG